MAISDALIEERNLAGAIPRSSAIHMVRVKNMDTAVLMATIWPNLANSCIVVKHNGNEATIVVMAELSMDEPMCETAAEVLQARLSYGQNKKKEPIRRF